MLTITQQRCSIKQKHTKYTQINTNKSIYVWWNGPSVTKPNPENCKNSQEPGRIMQSFIMTFPQKLMTTMTCQTVQCHTHNSLMTLMSFNSTSTHSAFLSITFQMLQSATDHHYTMSILHHAACYQRCRTQNINFRFITKYKAHRYTYKNGKN